MGSSLTSIGTITASGTLLQLGNGLLQALLPLRMQGEGLPVTAIGIVAAAYGLGFASGCFMVPVLIRHVGHIRAFVSLAAISAVVALSFTQAHSLAAWCLLRALSGVTLAGLFTVIDGWVSASATSRDRGRVLAVYIMCTKVALLISPLGIGLGNVLSDGLFMTVSGLMCLSLLPLSATLSQEPAEPRSIRIDFRHLFAVAPSAAVGALAVGLMNGPVIAITPVFGTGIGLSADQAAGLLFALQAGSLATQWPVGWLSDHFDRRYVIAGLAAAAALISGLVVLVGAQASPWFTFAAFALWGGTALCIYSVCIAHACDIVEPERIVPTISGLLVCWAAGSMLGPIPGAAMMEWIGPRGLFVYSAAIGLALVGFVGLRIAQRFRPATKGGFVDLAPTSAATGRLSPRADPARAAE